MKKLLIILFALCLHAELFAQSNVTVSYPISFGTGDIGHFIDKPSFRGINFDFRFFVQPNVAAGLNLGWITFYEEVNAASYTSGNETLHGKQFRYSNQVPIAATFAYFLGPEETTNPFVSLGIGTMYTRRNTDMNVYTVEQEAWNFLLQPEVGVQFMIAEDAAATISAKYNHGFKAGSELDDTQSYVSLNFGFSFF